MISFADKHPELTAEWDESNAPLTPWDVSYSDTREMSDEEVKKAENEQKQDQESEKKEPGFIPIKLIREIG